MKRSNRLVLLIGIFLALVAFVLVAVTLKSNGTGTAGPSAPPATANVVVAARDLTLGTKITQDAVTTKSVALVDKPVDSFSDPSQVIGQTARQSVTAGQLITSTIINSGGAVNNIVVPPGFVAIAVQVDQTTGVGTLIKPGDSVDIVVGLTGATTPEVVFTSPAPSTGPLQDLTLKVNPTTVKTVIQGLQVLGTLLPPADAAAAVAPAASGAPAGGTTLNGQQEIVFLAATAQQVEVIKYAQMDGTISLVLRSAKDCQASDGTASPCPIIPTTGITLRRMVDDFGVLPPQVVQVIEPTPYPASKKP